MSIVCFLDEDTNVLSSQGDANIKIEESGDVINVNSSEGVPTKVATSGPVMVPQDEKGEHNADNISEEVEEGKEESNMSDRLMEGTAICPVEKQVHSSPIVDILSKTNLDVNAPEFVLPQMQTFVTGDKDSCVESPDHTADVVAGKLFHYLLFACILYMKYARP